MCKALYSHQITLHLINEENLSEVYKMFSGPMVDTERIMAYRVLCLARGE